MIPIVWDHALPLADRDYEKASKAYEKKKAAWKNEMQRRSDDEDAPPEPQPPARRMQQGEDTNFLCFATALKIMVGSAIRVNGGLPRARNLLEQYLLGFLKLYGADSMKPNHHWAVHIPDEIMDFGPMYSFWAFLTERLNKILKNMNSNNWTGGRLEVSMMREFHRNAGLDAVLNTTLSNTNTRGFEHRFILNMMGHGGTEALGPIQDAARDEQTFTRVRAGIKADVAEKASEYIRLGLFRYYNKYEAKVHYNTPGVGTHQLATFITTYNFALLDGRRITPTSRSSRNSAGSSIIQARIRDKGYAGEIRSIFTHHQDGVENSSGTILAAIEWMKRSDFTPLESPRFLWDD
ncbi:hypothetical protein B0H10DRAFT_2358600 [Mycena sp. CBHHK59/15]|nr:hypothetical protein B0H10DRAFT_2358600 [Mycena sp. CBHHK59/15]